ncbi:MAG: ParB/RepB/Spo0J family partition protein [Candidatus Omnitrophica bacterium]|nr:ParB/RepB/Spo0J family partition protein [Candidatus Omnitrophota bacterium]
MERKVLGKGLEALINPAVLEKEEKVIMLDPAQIRPNRYQPRQDFDGEKLQELVASISEKGIVQPIIVRHNPGGEYELIAGERRLRAVKELGHKEVPAVVKKVNDQELLEFSIIENIQRQDLNSLEEAKAYETLINDFGFSQEQVAKTVGKNRSTVTNTLRLLSLPRAIKEALSRGMISFGHAKAILSLEDADKQARLCERIMREGLSVREAENLAGANKKEPKTKTVKTGKDPHVREVEEELQQIFATKVNVVHGKKRGKIQIEYYSLDDLERLLAIIRKQNQA